ncbi:Fine tangled pili major subunit [Pirellulimonas nuda]|uniref:Fine tangled pili major subunit n=1 Tax=Pirellulimonas nuda TaxID=2528009 RepID=A0A518D9W6_9BACT|nr:DNA starvation/stationary phase protection protein [Pirellulimonas nuda]QDU88285.1 Fine tangled pili major subunit [Pirellulimonas nuda]
MSKLKRHILEDADAAAVTESLGACLLDLIDLALQGKQLHWNVVGQNFRSIHLQLDEVIASARDASDDVAERIVTLARPASGRAATVAEKSRLPGCPVGLLTVAHVVPLLAERLEKCIHGMRSGIEAVGKVDPVSEDVLIQHCRVLEKHLWMVQAQEG